MKHVSLTFGILFSVCCLFAVPLSYTYPQSVIHSTTQPLLCPAPIPFPDTLAQQ